MEKIVHKNDIVEIKNFMTREECQKLIDYWNGQDDWDLTCFYNAYVISGRKPHKEEFGPVLGKLYERFKVEAESVFNRELKSLSQSAHKWTPGAFAADHADNAEPDGTPNAWAENKLVTILYLNDEYEGGYLTFKNSGIAIKPECGTLMVFDVGIENTHAVTEVLSGLRYTMLTSYDYADSNLNAEELKAQREAVKEAQDKQKQEWEKGIVGSPSDATMPENFIMREQTL